MGTNYYQEFDACEHCGLAPERRHIGKSSAGWCFALRVYPEIGIHDLADWERSWIRGRIVDEYGTVIDPPRMLTIVAARAGLRPPDESFCFINSCKRGPANLARHHIDGVHCIGHGHGTWDLMAGEFS